LEIKKGGDPGIRQLCEVEGCYSAVKRFDTHMRRMLDTHMRRILDTHMRRIREKNI